MIKKIYSKKKWQTTSGAPSVTGVSARSPSTLKDSDRVLPTYKELVTREPVKAPREYVYNIEDTVANLTKYNVTRGRARLRPLIRSEF